MHCGDINAAMHVPSGPCLSSYCMLHAAMHASGASFK
jgi:hypothetical protein